jgi:hypothetical protein
MRDIFNKIIKNKKPILSIFLFAVIGIFAMVNVSHADVSTAIGNIGKLIVGSPILLPLGAVTALIVFLVGGINTMIIAALTNIAQYNQFISEPPITNAWMIVRDLCNMFFILILLIIAFGTILRIESYNAKKLLPKLLIMAVLINFSKTIFGLVIDFSQVIMLTFVNAWGPNSGFVVLTKMKEFFSTDAVGILTGDKEFNLLETIAGMILGILFMIISGIVLVVLLATLVMRIVMIWIYIILSPFVFLGAAFTPMQKFTSKIWEDFIKQVIGGPVLAFFIWLSLISVDDIGKTMTSGADQCFSLPAIGCMNTLIPFIISIGMLIGGLMVAQQIGGAAGSIAGKGMAWAKRAPMLVGGGVLAVGGWGARKLKAKTGLEIRPTKVITGFKDSLKKKAEDEEILGESKSASALREGKLWGGLGASRDFAESSTRGFLWHRAWKGKDSVIAQTMGKGRSIKEIKSLQKRIGETKDPKEITKLNEQLEVKNKELDTFKTPQTFHADQKMNAMINDDRKHFGESDNADHLHEILMNAIDEGQQSVALAAFLHMPKVGHSNEALEQTIALEDFKDEEGNVVIQKGKTLSADRNGMAAFKEQYLTNPNKLGLTEHQALTAISQFSTSAKNAGQGHFNLAELVGIKNGSLRLRGAQEQQLAAAGEKRKQDPEQNERKGNRLSTAGEKSFVNEFGESDRVMSCDMLTVQDFINHMPIRYKEVADTKRYNPNAAENFYKNYVLLQTSQGKELLKYTKKSLLDIADKMEGTFKDHKGKNRTPAEVAVQVLLRGKEIYDQSQEAQYQVKKMSGSITPEQEILWQDRFKLSVEQGEVLKAKLKEEQIKTGNYDGKPETQNSTKKNKKPPKKESEEKTEDPTKDD